MQTVLAAYELKAKGMYVLMKMVYFQCLPFDFMMLIFFSFKEHCKPGNAHAPNKAKDEGNRGENRGRN